MAHDPQRSQDSLCEWVLSIHHVGPRGGAEVIKLGASSIISGATMPLLAEPSFPRPPGESLLQPWLEELNVGFKCPRADI